MLLAQTCSSSRVVSCRALENQFVGHAAVSTRIDKLGFWSWIGIASIRKFI
jgi:hypothetical protein